MVAKKHVTHEKEEAQKPQDETLRHAGVKNTSPNNKARDAIENNKQLHENPPPLAHVNPVTGEVLSQPLDTSKEANRNTVPGDGGVKDARPNNGMTGNPHTDKK